MQGVIGYIVLNILIILNDRILQCNIKHWRKYFSLLLQFASWNKQFFVTELCKYLLYDQFCQGSSKLSPFKK